MQTTKEASIIQVKTTQQLRETISKLEKELSELKREGQEIQFNGSARIGVWQVDRSDMGHLSTYFDGKIIFKVYSFSQHIGELPVAFNYHISSPNNSNIKTEFCYYLESNEKQPPWQYDNTYTDAITLRKIIEKKPFPEVNGILLWVNKKRIIQPNQPIMITT